VPTDFHKFVTERFGRRFPAGGKGWQTFIEENTNNEKEAFALFFQLRAQYDKSKKGRSDSAASSNRRTTFRPRLRKSTKGDGR
jgi:hypothetical protein